MQHDRSHEDVNGFGLFNVKMVRALLETIPKRNAKRSAAR